MSCLHTDANGMHESLKHVCFEWDLDADDVQNVLAQVKSLYQCLDNRCYIKLYLLRKLQKLHGSNWMIVTRGLQVLRLYEVYHMWLGLSK